jgi:hypothetical protein
MDFFNKWAVIFIDKLIKDFDLDEDSAIAIVGNAGHESGGFKSLQEKKPIVPGSRGGYGIMQWTGPRRRQYEAYCKRNKLDPADMNTNYKFLFVELKGPEGRVLPKLRAAKTLSEKVLLFSKGFLRPGIPHMESRQIWAKRAKAAWTASGVTHIVVDDPGVEEPEVPKKPTGAVVPPAKSILERILDIILILFKGGQK